MRASLTTVLDLLGMVLVVLALALAVRTALPGPWGDACFLLVTGLGLLAISWIADRKAAA